MNLPTRMLISKFIELLQVYFIGCILPLVLSLWIAKLLFKDRIDFKRPLNIIRWTVLTFVTLNWLAFAISPAVYLTWWDSYDVYYLGFFLVLGIVLVSMLFPYILVNGVAAKSFLVVFIVAVFLNINWYAYYIEFFWAYYWQNTYESFAFREGPGIRVISPYAINGQLWIVLKGIILAVLLIVLTNLHPKEEAVDNIV